MSLINKLLQDLEQRQAADASSVVIPAGVQSVFRPRRRVGWLVPAMMLLPVVAAAGLWVMMSNGSAPQAPVAKAPVQPAPAPAAAPAKVEVAKVEVAKAPEPVVAPVAVVKAVEPVAAPAPIAKIAPPAPVAKAAPQAPAAAPALVAAAPQPKPAAPREASRPEPKPQPAAKPPIADAKIAGLYPGVVKKPVNAGPAAPAPAEAAPAPVTAAPTVARLSAPVEGQSQKTFTPRQQSDNLYKQAVLHAQQGQGKEARDLLAKALEAAPQNSVARQLLASLLVEANKLPDALAVLREGVRISPEHTGMWMSLARLQLEFGDAAAATATLEQGLPSAGEDAPYNAFYAALMQRAGRHDAALKHYLIALRSDPGMPNWLVGAGISMQALGRDADAAEAFQRAKDGGQLPPAFTAFVDQRLATLKR